MTKTYQIKINQGKDTQTLDIPQAGVKGQAVTVKAVSGARYQLIDTTTQYGPENIRVSRQGKDMKVSFEGSNTTDLVIEDYYKVSPEGYNGLIGEAETGRFYEYIPESASGLASVPMLAESGQAVGMALGGAEVAPAGAAVGVLAAGLFNPVWLGVGALGAAAAGGGGGGGSGTSAGGGATDTTAPTGQTGKLAKTSDSGVSDSDAITNDDTPTIEGEAEKNAKVEVFLKDKDGQFLMKDNVKISYTATADANGKYTVNINKALPDTSKDGLGTKYTPVIKVTDAAQNSSEKDGESFVIDKSIGYKDDANRPTETEIPNGTKFTVQSLEAIFFKDGHKQNDSSPFVYETRENLIPNQLVIKEYSGAQNLHTYVIWDVAGNVGSEFGNDYSKIPAGVVDNLNTSFII